MYCSVQDLMTEFKGLIISNSSTALTSAQADEWITQETNYINAIISVRYITPIDSTLYPEAFSILKRICTHRVCERVKNKLEVKSNATQLSTEQKFIQNYAITPNKDLEMIVKGNLILKGVPLVGSGDVSGSCVSDCNVSGGNVFDVSIQQW
jgi:hypothetical protein